MFNYKAALYSHFLIKEKRTYHIEGLVDSKFNIKSLANKDRVGFRQSQLWGWGQLERSRGAVK